MVVAWWSIIPFVLLLGCIAVLPLIPATEKIWDRNLVKLIVALVLGVPIAAWFLLSGESTTVIHALLEYFQFIVLIGSLFVASGGIFLVGDIKATPRNNTIFLAVGGVLASFIGTTGAAMLLIRPILNTNQDRKHRTHTVIYTIFIVANCGGLLTPLGDPPLFLGMLRGVPFEWTFGLWPYWVFVNALLLISYFALDSKMYAKEPAEALAKDAEYATKLGLRGASGLLFLAIIIIAVAFIPSVDLHAIETGHATASDFVPWREVVMLLSAVTSFLVGDRGARFNLNKFTWTPILEVGALFIGIFLTMMPALQYLSQIAHKIPLGEISCSSSPADSPPSSTMLRPTSPSSRWPPRSRATRRWRECPSRCSSRSLSVPSWAEPSRTSATDRTSWSNPSRIRRMSRRRASAVMCGGRCAASCRSSLRWCSSS